MDILTKKFKTAEVLAAANISNANLQTWIRRGVILSHSGSNSTKIAPITSELSMPGSPGLRRVYSFFTVMEIAVAKALTDVGVDVPDAFRAAISFAHAGRNGRLPSIPYTEPSISLLCVTKDLSEIVCWKPGNDVLSEVIYTLGQPAAFVVLEINPLFERVVTALGYDPDEVLRVARHIVLRDKSGAIIYGGPNAND